MKKNSPIVTTKLIIFYISGVELLRFDVNPSNKKPNHKNHQSWKNDIASQMINHIDEQIEVFFLSKSS